MLQDRGLKAAALRYAISKRWLPQLELEVSTMPSVGRSQTNITDVDVFAAVPDDFLGFRSLLIDCKTRKGESPISRALWQMGVMTRLGADRGICILRVPRIEPDHRYTAAQFGVTLVSEAEFPAFAAASAPGYGAPLGALAEMDRWDEFFAIRERFPRLERANRFSRSGYWMSENAAEACSRTIVLTTTLRAELDPARAEHIAIVGDLTALLLHALSRLAVGIFAAYLQPKDRHDLSQALLFLLHGGRASYIQLNRIRRLVIASRAKESEAEYGSAVRARPHRAASQAPLSLSFSASESDSSAAGVEATAAGDAAERPAGSAARGRDLSLPEWDRFVELVRQMLDAPLEVSRAPLLMRELAWASLGARTGGLDGVTDFARTLAAASPQGARFAVLALDYLTRAASLPREFADILTSRLLETQVRR